MQTGPAELYLGILLPLVYLKHRLGSLGSGPLSSRASSFDLFFFFAPRQDLPCLDEGALVRHLAGPVHTYHNSRARSAPRLGFPSPLQIREQVNQIWCQMLRL